MLKIIKKYWMPIAIALGALVLAILKLDQHEFAFSFVALALLLVAVKNLLLQMEYDELHDSHAELVVEYIEELNNNLEFIQKSRATLLDIMTTVDDVKESTKELPAPKKKRGRPKKV
jgi:hypothetical protein